MCTDVKLVCGIKILQGGGIKGLVPELGGRHRKNMSFEEAIFLEKLKTEISKGKTVVIKDIKTAYDEIIMPLQILAKRNGQDDEYYKKIKSPDAYEISGFTYKF